MITCPLCGASVAEIRRTAGREIETLRHHNGACLFGFTPPVTLNPDGVYNMDCIAGMQMIPAESVDLIVTDPPYLIDYASNRRKDKTHDFCTAIQGDSNPELIRDYMRECYRILKNNHAAYVFCSSKTLEFFKKAASDAGFLTKNTIIWVKNSWTAGDLKAQFGQQYEPILLLNKGRAPFNGGRITDVWQFDRVAGKAQLHQNQKPLPLIEQCIEKHSNEGDMVFDGFMGSGTTAVAAARLGRQFLGFEIEPKYFDIIHDRLKEVVDHEDT